MRILPRVAFGVHPSGDDELGPHLPGVVVLHHFLGSWQWQGSWARGMPAHRKALQIMSPLLPKGWVRWVAAAWCDCSSCVFCGCMACAAMAGGMERFKQHCASFQQHVSCLARLVWCCEWVLDFSCYWCSRAPP